MNDVLMTKDVLATALVILYDLDKGRKKELMLLSKELLTEMYDGVISNARAYNDLVNNSKY